MPVDAPVTSALPLLLVAMVAMVGLLWLKRGRLPTPFKLCSSYISASGSGAGHSAAGGSSRRQRPAGRRQHLVGDGMALGGARQDERADQQRDVGQCFLARRRLAAPAEQRPQALDHALEPGREGLAYRAFELLARGVVGQCGDGTAETRLVAMQPRCVALDELAERRALVAAVPLQKSVVDGARLRDGVRAGGGGQLLLGG